MKIRLLTEKSAKREIIRLVRESKHIDIAVAWAGLNDVTSAVVKHHRKLRRVVIGTHLYQTNPKVLRKLETYPVVKCMPPSGRLFHPKIYLFEMDTAVEAIIGSHNLTAGAFEGGNTEASVLLQGTRDDYFIQEVVTFVLQKWHDADQITEDFLFAYEKQYENCREKRKALGEFHRLKKPRDDAAGDVPFDLSWSDFVRRVKKDKHHSLKDRLSVLERAATLFASGKSFEKMTRDERRALAGTYGSKEATLDGLPWSWFGTMFGQGDFKNLVNTAPERLSKALGEIPLSGDVTEQQYRAFAKTFREAFKNKTHKGGVSTASRLLAMKRPDFFVGVNNANRRGLCEAYGVAHFTLSLDNYWERIVIPTQLSPWWRHSRPRTALLGLIWDNRAALADCIYYEPA